MAKERIDVLLVEKLGFESREKAQRTIMAGLVYVDQYRVDKPGTKVSEDAHIEVKGQDIPYVSRGGLKLEKAISSFGIQLASKKCMDIGASTGGFTDCMLQQGAQHVFSVDVGYGQLDWKLRNDPRVSNMERTNIRYVTLENIGEPVDFISIDVSFISLKLVLPVALQLLQSGGEIVFLIKPQFEAGRDHVKKSGVIRDSKVHLGVLETIAEFCETLPLEILEMTFSPIKGPKGNIEFLAYGRKVDTKSVHKQHNLSGIVSEAHARLNSKEEEE